jgi:phosphate transport system permease protein
MLFAIPIGLGSAIYLSEYARPRVRKTVKPVLEILAGIPTVAIGFFAVSFILPEIIQPLWPGELFGGAVGKPFMALAAGLGIGLMIVPIIASISEDAMSAVPRGLREGAYAMGATKMEVSTKVVFPAALSGIVASIMLAISRAVGETMIVVLAAGSTPNLTFNPVEAIQAMTSYIAVTATGDIPAGSISYKSVFAVGTLLFVMTLAMNVISIRLVRKYREVYE